MDKQHEKKNSLQTGPCTCGRQECCPNCGMCGGQEGQKEASHERKD